MSAWENMYLRQIQAKNFDIEKQEILAQTRVLIVGLGGVGSAASMYLSLAGVIQVGLCDHGLVEESNLHRQILYTAQDIGMRKVDVAMRELTARSPALRPIPYLMDVQKGLADFADPYDLILDCLDNSPARLAVAAFAHRLKIPVISGGARDWGGFVGVFHSPHTACFSCLYGIPERTHPYPSPGIVGPAAGTIGAWQAARTIRLLTQRENLPRAEYTSIDLWNQDIHMLHLKKRSQCPVCSQGNQDLLEFQGRI